MGELLRLNLTNFLFLALGMVLMAAVGQLPPLRRTTPTAGASESVATGRQGPWGELEYVRFALEEPDDYLPDSTRPLETPPWFFEKHTLATLAAWFESLSAPASVKPLLLDTRRWQASPQGVFVQPTRELLLGLGGEARQQIYSVLHDSASNPMHQEPFRFRRDGFDEWFAYSGLSPEKLELIRSLTFTNRGGALCLVDIDVLQQSFTPREFNRVFHSLYAEPSFLMHLRVRAGADVEPLVAYWGGGGRERVVRPILRSLARAPGGGSIDVSRLLPPFAQARLYTFSPANTNAPADGPDCFWTALNFFNDPPDVRLSEQAYALAKLNTDYAETRDARRLGDVLVLLDERGKTVHACVFIADDVVFTKNGSDYLQPWVLMKIPDMLARYATDRPTKLMTLRPRRT